MVFLAGGGSTITARLSAGTFLERWVDSSDLKSSYVMMGPRLPVLLSVTFSNTSGLTLLFNVELKFVVFLTKV